MDFDDFDENRSRSNLRFSVLPLPTARDYSDASPLLRSVAASLSTILGDRTVANRHAIESLIPRVRMLAESLCAPVSEGDIREESRRKTLAR